jgi:hypothetical protein
MSVRVGIVIAVALGGVLSAGAALGAAAGLSLSSQRLTPVRTCTISATPTGTTAVLDASVRQAAGTSNFGSTTTDDVASGSAANRRLYLRFDLAQCSPAIPTSAIVRGATLRLWASALPAVCRTLDVFVVSASWTEAALTWNNQPFGTAINNPPSASRVASADAGTPSGCQNQSAGYLSGLSVTSSVAGIVAGTVTNNGWMIRDDAEGSATTRTVTISAKELGTVAQLPQLVITYVLVA